MLSGLMLRFDTSTLNEPLQLRGSPGWFRMDQHWIHHSYIPFGGGSLDLESVLLWDQWS